MVRPEDIARIADWTDVASRVHSLARGDLFTKVTDLRPALVGLEQKMLQAHGANLIGSQVHDTLAEINRGLVSQAIGSSMALDAARFSIDPKALGLATPRIRDLYVASAGIRELADRWQAPLREFAAGMERVLEEQGRLDEQTDAFVRAHGWPVPLNLPVRTYRRIVGLAGDGKREVNRLMQQWFRPGTRAFSSTTALLIESPAFASRRPLVRQALTAHKRGDWYLVINALLPLVEGVLVDFAFQDSPAPRGGRPRAAIEELKDKEGSTLGIAVGTLETLLLSAGANIALFEQFDLTRYGEPGEPRSLNRHAILHGAARRYGSERNALKLVLLLATMAQAFEYSQAD